MKSVSVLGANGYTGAELVNILLSHPEVSLKYCVSRCYAGQELSSVYGGFVNSGVTLSEMNIQKICSESEYVFLALPHGVSMETAKTCVDMGVKVIDLSGDYRYDDISVYEKWYGKPHKYEELNQQAVYGLCEVYAEKITNANIVANPGCYTTASILPLYPLLKEKVVDNKNIIVDALSGVSGAGRKEDLVYSFCEVDGSAKAYGVATHRHTSEIEQELSKAFGGETLISFTPHLLPIKRGILATVYANLTKDVTRQDILNIYRKFYSSPFVTVLEQGLPEIKHVANTNNIHIGFVIDERLNRLVVVSAIDNLQKGAAGQAVQNFNIMAGHPQELGLNRYTTGI